VTTHRKPRRGGQAGQNVVEFALVATFLILLVGGIAQFGMVYNVLISVQTAARESARVAAMNPRNTGLFSSPYTPAAPRGSGTPYTCSGPSDPILACKAAYNSTHQTLGGLIDPTTFVVSLSAATFPGNPSPGTCGGIGTNDGVVTVSISYNAPLFVPIIGQMLSTGGNNYRTVTSVSIIRVEPCANTSGS